MMVRSAWHGAGLALAGLVALLVVAAPPSEARAAACDRETQAAVLKPATAKDRSVRIDCSLILSKGDVVTRQIILEGGRASGITIDCGGGTIDGREGKPNHGKDMIVIRSKGKTREDMIADRPTDITVTDCRIFGSIRVLGLGPNGEGELVTRSSHGADHTRMAQAAAPSNILLDRLTISGQGRTPLYLAPGVTRVTLQRSTVAGKSNGPGIYLDAESAENRILDNEIRVDTRNRELIAVDGSARNLIAGNDFSSLSKGGIFLYRNCGEGGTVRHQAPSGNVIRDNEFYYKAYVGIYPAILLGARNGDSDFCEQDRGFPFGSSTDDTDHADGNSVVDNRIVNRPTQLLIIDFGRNNLLSGNQMVLNRRRG